MRAHTPDVVWLRSAWPSPLLLTLFAALAIGCVEDQDPDTIDPEPEPEADAEVFEPPPEGPCPPDEPADGCGVCGGNGPHIYYADVDGDGVGDFEIPIVACVAPDGFVAEGGDPEPDCATDDTDVCGVCGGPGQQRYFADADGDGAGDDAVSLEACAAPDGFVAEGGDPEPLCATDDTDDCGVCGGPGLARFYADTDEDGAGDDRVFVDACGPPMGFVEVGGDPDPFCATDDTDDCGVCAGGNADLDCVGVCFGEALVDGCGRCVGGTTGRVAAAADADRDGRPDVCDQCPIEPAARTVIQWTRVAQGDGLGGPYTFQIVLYESGDFSFQYPRIEPYEATPTIGFQGLSGEGAVALDVGGELVRESPSFFFQRQADGRAEYLPTVPPEFVDVEFAGGEVELNEEGQIIALGFEFPFGGETFDTARVHADGTLVFSGPAPGPENGALPRGDLGAFLAPFWDDLDPGRSGAIQVHRAGPECEQDCAGMFGGVAFVDACGECVAGSTGSRPDGTRDCAGTCGGEAFIDACGQCAGGESGNEPQGIEDCPQAPDLIINEDVLGGSVIIDYIDVEDECLFTEGCVTGVGRRKLLRFTTQIANIGNADLRLGRPEEGNPLWDWGECHGHWHFDQYATYDLVDVQTGEVLPIGAKNGFAVIDIGVYDPEIAVDGCRGYNGRNQGITAGCQDTYGRGLQCQWIDVTGVEDGFYDLVVTTNPDQRFAELNYDNNSGRVRVRIDGDQVRLIDEELNCDDDFDDDGDGDVDCDDRDCRELCELPPREPANVCPLDALGPELGGESRIVVEGVEAPVADALSAPCAGAGRGEAAYLFTAPAEDRYVFHTLGSTFDTSVYVLDGGCDGAPLGCSERHPHLGDDGAFIEVDLVEGQQVAVAVDGMLYDDGEYRLTVQPRRQGCPEVDLEQALGAGVAEGSNREAPNRLIAPCGAGGNNHHTYGWTAPEAGTYVIDTFGSRYDTVLFLLDAACGLEFRACNDDSGSLQSRLEVELEAGESIVIGVGGYSGRQGDYVLNINRLGEVVACGDEALGEAIGEDLFEVITDGLDDLTQVSCVEEGNDLGLTWTAPAADRYLFHTFESSTNTAIAVREGGCEGEELGCNASAFGDRGDTPVDSQAAVELDLEAGAEVAVIVDGLSDEGSVAVAIRGRAAGCPDADLGAALGESIAEGSNADAGTRLLSRCGASVGQIAYGWTAPAAGTYAFDTFGSGYDTVLEVLRGACGESIACNDDAEGLRSRVEVELAEGEVITLVVGGFRGRSGDFVLNAAVVEPPPEEPPPEEPAPEAP